MKLLSGEIRNLVTFGCARITSISITFTNTIQLILGTNGSGKSNLLRQLSPLPASRTDFLAGGYKKLVIEHEGHEYTLISDFSKKDSPHEFLEDGENLNEGGTTEVQRELVVDKLGWTPQTEALCFNSFSYTTMTTSLRQAFFSKLNPYKINFLLEKSKKAKTRIRNCKAILNRLQERKTVLENQLISPETLTLLRDEHKTLLDHSGFLNKTIIRIETLLDTTTLSKPEGLEHRDPKDALLSMIQQSKTLANSLWRIGRDSIGVDRHSPHEQENLIEKENAVLSERVDQVTATLNDLYESRRVNENNLHDCVEEEVLQRINTELLSLQEELDNLSRNSTEEPFPQDMVRQADKIEHQFREALGKFHDSPPRLLTRKAFDRKHRFMSKWEAYRYDLDRSISIARSRIASWEKTLTLKLEDIPDQPCAKLKCPLYASFKSTHDTTRSNIEREEQFVRNALAKSQRVRNYLEAQENQLRALGPYQQALLDLFSLVQTYPACHRFFSKADTLDQIARNPQGLVNRIQHHFTLSRNTYRVPALKEKLLKAQLEYNQHKTLTGKEKDHLTSMINETDRKIAAHEKLLSELHGRLNDNLAFLKIIDAYQKLTDSSEAYLARLDELHAYCAKRYDLEQLDALKRVLQSRVNDMVGRLADIQKTLAEQDRIQDRLTSEILNEITATEEEKVKLEYLGDALDGLPQEYTLRFMNALFESANAFIAKVFTYKLAMYPMTAETWKSYKIPYRARSIDGPDISKGSTAQAEIINLALTLACRQSEGLNDYPLFLDEVGKNFDPTHQQRLLDLVLFITDNALASQLFIVNHHAVIHGGLMHTETLVLDDSNIMKTENYNTHAHIETY